MYATPICINLTHDDNGKHAIMDVMSRSSVREYVVTTELYKGGKRELQTKYTRAAFSMELLFDMLCNRHIYAMTLFEIPPERASTRSSSKEIAYKCMIKP